MGTKVFPGMEATARQSVQGRLLRSISDAQQSSATVVRYNPGQRPVDEIERDTELHLMFVFLIAGILSVYVIGDGKKKIKKIERRALGARLKISRQNLLVFLLFLSPFS